MIKRKDAHRTFLEEIFVEIDKLKTSHSDIKQKTLDRMEHILNDEHSSFLDDYKRQV